MNLGQQDDTLSVEPCDVCGAVGWPESIATCSKCNVAREHIYCMRISVRKALDDWICETCHYENYANSLNMNISRDPGFDASNNITEPEITPSASGVQMTKEHGSHSLARGGSTSRENAAEFVSKLDGHMEGSSGNNMNGISSRKRRRGIIKFTKLGAHHGATESMHVEFDDSKNPLGAEGDRFISYIGFIARSKVGILFPNWKSVPETTKDMVWKDILQTYDVPPTREMKKHWLQQVRGRWKDFKTILTRVYIRGAKKNEDPCLTYPFLDQETWRKFVKSRQDPKFQKLSAVNKERQSKNLYQHCMSRGGYKKVEQNIMQANLKAMQEVAKSNPSIIVEAPSRPTRHQKWKEGRIKKGQYINPKVAEIAEKIDALEKQSSQGSFTQRGRMDILATAIGKLDHPGRVRGIGKTIGLIQYFGPTSRSSPANVSKEEITAMVREQFRKELEQEIREQISKELQEIRQSIRNDIIAEFRDEMRTMVSNLQHAQAQQENCTSQASQSIQSTKDSYNPDEASAPHDLSPKEEDGDMNILEPPPSFDDVGVGVQPIPHAATCSDYPNLAANDF